MKTKVATVYEIVGGIKSQTSFSFCLNRSNSQVPPNFSNEKILQKFLLKLVKTWKKLFFRPW